MSKRYSSEELTLDVKTFNRNLMASMAKAIDCEILYMDDEKRELRKKRRKAKENNLKWAWIYVGNTKMMAWVDNKTKEAFKADGYEKTNMRWKKYGFTRWCTSFDF